MVTILITMLELLFASLVTQAFSAMNGRQDFIIPNSVYQTGTSASGAPIYSPNTNIITRGNGWAQWSYSTFSSTQSLYMTSAAFWKLREVFSYL